MERRLMLGTVAMALALGSGVASAQTQPQPYAPAQNTVPRAPSATTGQAAPQSQQPGNAAGSVNTGTAANANAPQNATANQQGVITLNEQQNTRVATAIRQANVRPLTNVNFSIAVGTTIPADIQVNPLPPALVEVVPQYRGFNFVVVEQEALIINPTSRAIVAVIPFEAQRTTGANTAPAPAPAPSQATAPLPRVPAQAAGPPPREHKKKAERHRKTDKDRRVIIEERRSTTGAGHREPRVGDRVPDDAVIERRPVEVYRDEPPARGDRHHPSARDIPLIGPLFGPPDED